MGTQKLFSFSVMLCSSLDHKLNKKQRKRAVGPFILVQ